MQPTPSAQPELSLSAAGHSDIGQRRSHNEDVVLVRADLDLYMVADGAGGHNAGDVAAHLAARSISNFVGATVRKAFDAPEFDEFGMPYGARRLASAVLKANGDIIEVAKSSHKHKGMGTTVVAALFSPRSGMLHVAHVGDSRCYRLRGGHLEQLTQDHSLLNDVLETRPDLDDAVLKRLPRNVVTRALGMDDKLRISVRSYAVVNGDRYLLCSDGLSGPLSAEEISELLTESGSAEDTVNALIARANQKGGPDNIAALVVDCKGGSELALPLMMPGDQWDVPEGIHPRGMQTSEPELLLLGIEDLDLDGIPQFHVVPAHTATPNLSDALTALVDPKLKKKKA